MKTKLISLLIALLCMTLFMVSCSEACVEHIDADYDGICDNENCEDAVKQVTVEEHEHEDADADGVCDTENCDTIIIVNTVVEKETVEIVVPTTPEAKKDMVVKVIPTANIKDYINFDYAEKQAYFNNVMKEFVLGDYYGYRGFVVISKKTNELVKPVEDDATTPDVDEFYPGSYEDVYTVSDISGAKELVLFTYTTVEYKGNEAAPYVAFNLTGYEYNGVFMTLDYYDAKKEATFRNFYKAGVENKTPLRTFELGKYTCNVQDQVTYFTYGDKVVAYDNATYTVIQEGAKDLFVYRPNFDVVVGNYGVVYSNWSMQVYDLSKWISCVYNYEVSNYADESKVFALSNGTYLYQSLVRLPNNAVSYDLDRYGIKYDIVYEIVDPAKQTVTKAEFGYYINGEVEIDDVKVADANLFEVYAIDKSGNMAHTTKSLLVNGKLDVLFEVNKFVINQNGYDFMLVADNYAVVSIILGDREAYAAVNLATGAVTYLPNYVDEVYDTCYMIGDVLYNYDGTKKIDLSDYEIVENYDSYLILSKTVEVEKEEVEGSGTYIKVPVTTYHYLDLNKATATVSDAIEGFVSVEYSNSDMFVLKTQRTEASIVEGTPVAKTITEYKIYNNDGVLVRTISDVNAAYGWDGEYLEAEGAYCLHVYLDTEEDGVKRYTCLMNVK